MADRLDALMARSYTKGGEQKTSYTKVGVAWPLNGGGWRLELEAVPVPTIYEGKPQLSILLMPPRDEQPKAASEKPAFMGGFNPESDDVF